MFPRAEDGLPPSGWGALSFSRSLWAKVRAVEVNLVEGWGGTFRSPDLPPPHQVVDQGQREGPGGCCMLGEGRRWARLP